MDINNTVEINGTFSKVAYESNGFYIILIDSFFNENLFPQKDCIGNISFAAKGHFTIPKYKGQTISVTGDWKYDAKKQKYTLEVRHLVPVLPKTREDSLVFLKAIPHVGPRIAERVVDVFDGDLAQAASDPTSLMGTVRGVTKTKALAICTEIKQINAIYEIGKNLKGIVSADAISRIVKQYGEKAIEIINNSPFQMVTDRVLSFAEADAIALKHGGIKKLDEERLKAGILYSMKTIKMRRATIIAEKTILLEESQKLLRVTDSEIIKVAKKMTENYEIISAKKYVYLKSDYVCERDLSDKIVSLSTAEVPEKEIKVYSMKLLEWKKEHEDISLAERQEIAVESVMSNYLSMVTGGPGTGKTTVQKTIMDTYKKMYPKGNITLMAPASLAAKRMSGACGFVANTIHSALGIVPADNELGFSESDPKTLSGLIIIDEFSMVGIHLASFLFNSIVWTPDTRVVVVGDVDQLPPVSAGAVLESLIECGKVHVTRLNRNFRQEAGSAIVDAAYAINNGDTKLAFTGNFQNEKISNSNIDVETTEIFESVKTAFKKSIEKFGLDQTYVLAPQRKSTRNDDGTTTTKTLLSTSSLNPILRDIANPAMAGKPFCKAGARIFRLGDRVVNMKNGDVPNGEIGIITKITTLDVTSIVVDFSGKMIEYTADKLKDLDLAYCITVHKAQGCEYDSVIMPLSMTQGIMLQRNLLYTAVTRAKKNVLLIGSKSALDKAITTVRKKEKRDLLSARIQVKNKKILERKQNAT